MGLRRIGFQHVSHRNSVSVYPELGPERGRITKQRPTESAVSGGLKGRAGQGLSRKRQASSRQAARTYWLSRHFKNQLGVRIVSKRRETISYLLVNVSVDMTDNWDLKGFVISSRYRKIVLQELSESPSTPSRLAERSGASIASISHALSELRAKGCVELLVDEDRRKGRVYGLSETGSALLEDLEKQQLL